MASNKRIKDPNAPKRPPSAFLLFANHCRANNEDVKSVKVTEQLQKIGALWKDVNADLKQKFEDEAKKLKDSYTKAMEEYTKTDNCKEFLEKKKNAAKAEISAKKSKKEKRKRAVSISGYQVFMREFRSKLTEEDKAAMVDSVMKVAAEKWKELTPEQLASYKEVAAKETKLARENEGGDKDDHEDESGDRSDEE